ncbi:phosphoglycerate dehydrogenase [Oscillospiraceae bacterium 52-8]
MYTVKTLNQISLAGLRAFDPDRFVLDDGAERPDALLCRSADLHQYPFDPCLAAIGRAGAGVNNIPVEECSRRGIAVFNTPGANAGAVKEMVLCALLLASRKIPAALAWVQGLKGEADLQKRVEAGKKAFIGPELGGKTLGVIGMGAIGIQVANTARHLGMEVIGYDPYMSVEAAWKVSRQIAHAASLEEVYQKSDYITLHVPYTADTKGMVDAAALAQMKDGVRLLNFARGELVEAPALLAAVEGGKVACYVTDFAQEELLGVEGVVVLPHLGASTPESEDNCAVMAARELMDYLENGNIKNAVNLPTCRMARSGRARVCVIHRNIPAMITQISSALSGAGLNIENLVNKSRGEYAYTMLDLADELPEPVEGAIRAIEGVVRVRVLSRCE